MLTDMNVTQARRAALEFLEQLHGRLDPEVVVEAARDPDSSLHDAFEWDDTEAARIYRLRQASHLIRVCKVTIVPSDTTPRTVRVVTQPALMAEGPMQQVRAFQCVTLDGERTYLNTQRVLEDAGLRAQMLATARRELRAFRSKYKILSELASVFDAIDRVT